MMLPVDKYDELAKYDGSVIVERTKGEMSARCDKEGANFLALNLANDIITNRISFAEARQKYSATIMQMLKGDKPMYMQELAFDAPERNINNSDITIMNMTKVRELKKGKN